MTHAFGQLQFKGVEIRAPLIKHSPYRAKVSVNGVQGRAIIGRRVSRITSGIKRPDIACRGLSGNDEGGLINAEGLMDAARSHVSSHRSQAGRKLVLHIEVPLR